MKNYNETFAYLKKYNQEHLLKFYNELSENEKEELLNSIENTDFDEIEKITKKNINKTNNELNISNTTKDASKIVKDISNAVKDALNTVKDASNTTKNTLNDIAKEDLKPIDAIDKYSLSQAEKEKYEKIGEELIKNRKVAVCTLAGGQGSRLGHNGPKGTFIVPLKEPKSIFQISAEHMLNSYKKYDVYIDWYIMTSEENDSDTKKFFEENKYFNYPKEKIKFFKQGTLPLTDNDGKIMLKSKCEVFNAPNGNGGIFKALEDNKIIEELKNNNVEILTTCNVDNILIKPIDSLMFGIMKEKNSDIGMKSIIKRSPEEKVGVCCLKSGKPTVIEYIDLPVELANARNEDGTLKFGETHFGNNYFKVDLLEKIANQKLPYHCAKKKNKVISESGELEEFETSKYEMFIFDGFEMADKVSIFRVKREEEFAPIKNKDGEDSPYTASKMYEEYFDKLY